MRIYNLSSSLIIEIFNGKNYDSFLSESRLNSYTILGTA